MTTFSENYPRFPGDYTVIFPENKKKFKEYFFANKNNFIASEEGSSEGCSCYFKRDEKLYNILMEYDEKLLKISIPYTWFK